MLTPFLKQWMLEGVIKALCWTFIHSLWQGLVAAILAGIFIISTRKAKANIRYNSLVVLFALFMVVVGVSFLQQLFHFSSIGDNSSPVTITSGNVVLVPFAEGNSYFPVQKASFIEAFIAYLNKNAAFLVLIWFFFFIVKCMQLFSGLHYIHRLRHSQVSPVLEEWTSKTKQLTKALGIQRQVTLLESGLINVPLTIGYLKATILVPLGLLANLPPDQVESVLLHELAHIRRKDYVVNILQSFAETIFFFNPAILWISSLIRQEREACCDDIVLQHMPQKKSYLEALVSFQECSFANAGHVIALANQKNYLLNRIKRMITRENEKLNSMEKTILLLGIIAITAFGFISKKESSITVTSSSIESPKPYSSVSKTTVFSQPLTSVRQLKQKVKSHSQPWRVKKDTVPGKEKNVTAQDKEFYNVTFDTHDDGKTKTNEIEATDKDGKKYRMKKVNDVLTEFTVNDKPVSREEYAQVIDRIERVQAERAEKAMDDAHQRKIERQARKQEHQEKKMALQKEHQKMQEEQQNKHKEMRKQQEQDKRLMKEQSRKDDSLRQEKNKQIISLRKKPGHGSNNEINSIISDLFQDKVVADSERLSFSLNNNELIVNGTRQPKELHQSLKKKYLRSPGDHFNYSKSGGTTTTSINKD